MIADDFERGGAIIKSNVKNPHPNPYHLTTKKFGVKF
jgi:hypothetical protein